MTQRGGWYCGEKGARRLCNNTVIRTCKAAIPAIRLCSNAAIRTCIAAKSAWCKRPRDHTKRPRDRPGDGGDAAIRLIPQ